MRQAVIVSSGKSGDNEYRKSPSGGSTAAIMSLGKSGDNEYRKIRSGGPQTEDDGQILAPPPIHSRCGVRPKRYVFHA